MRTRLPNPELTADQEEILEMVDILNKQIDNARKARKELLDDLINRMDIPKPGDVIVFSISQFEFGKDRTRKTIRAFVGGVHWDHGLQYALYKVKKDGTKSHHRQYFWSNDDPIIIEIIKENGSKKD